MRALAISCLLFSHAAAQAPTAGLRVSVVLAGTQGGGAHVQHRPLDLPDACLRDRWLVADAKGLVELRDLTPGRHELTLDRGARKVVTAEAGTTREVVLTASGGTNLRGRVRGPDGKPVADCGIWLSSGDDGDEGEIVTRSDAEGGFELRCVPQDRAIVAIRPDGTLGKTFLVAEGEAGDFRLEVPAGPASGEIRGRVVDGSGKPLVDARVVCGARTCGGKPRGARRGAQPSPPLSARTNEAGEFRLRAASALLSEAPVWVGMAQHARRLLVLRVPRAGLDVGDVRLDAEAALGGVVVDEHGMPVAAPSVALPVPALSISGSASAGPSGGPAWVLLDVSGDAQGRFRIGGLPAGTFWIEALGGESGEAHERIAVPRGAVLETRLVLAPRKTQAGQLVGEDGKPLGGLTVFAAPEYDPRRRVPALADGDGRFGLELAACEHALTVNDPRNAGRMLALDNVARLRPRADPWRIVVPKAALATSSISGTVLDDSGVPIAGCQVAIRRRDAGDYDNMLTTDAAGAFRYGPLPAGCYQVAAFAKGKHWLHGKRIELGVGQDAVAETLRYPPCGTVRARLLAEDGAETAAASLYVVSRKDQRPHQLQGAGVAEAQLAPGDYWLCSAMVRRPDGNPLVARQPSTIRAGETTKVDAKLRPVATRVLVVEAERQVPYVEYSMTVVDKDGAEVYAFRRSLGGSDRARRWTENLLLPPGAYRVRLEDELGRKGAIELAIEALDADWAPAPLVLR